MNSDAESRRRFEDLWTDFLEGELEEGSAAELNGLLSSNPDYLRAAVEQYQTHRQLGFLSKNPSSSSDWFVRETLARLQMRRDDFAPQTMERLFRQIDADPKSNSNKSVVKVRTRSGSSRLAPSRLAVAGIATALCLLCVVPFLKMTDSPSRPVGEPTSHAVPLPASSESILFTKIARAQFFGALSPGVNTELVRSQTYVLSRGMVELTFPKGAVAVLEGPAVFSVAGGECLNVDAGRCSVYAPEGAQGFQVRTPETTIVDRGTRFSVNVTESSETEVQVIEGIADLYEKSRSSHHEADESSVPSARQEVRLTSRQAMRVHGSGSSPGGFSTEPTVFRQDQYLQELPDRVVSYAATQAADGRAEFLTEVTVQRGGSETRYAVEDLIPVELIWFRAEGISRDGHVLGSLDLPKNLLQVSSDHSLVTGVINPGGSVVPLKSAPILEHEPTRGVIGTPGIGYRFQRPVRNRPGPDIVLFETHPITSPTNGDAFHVSPLKFSPGKRSLTVREFDLSLVSPESLPVTKMFVHYDHSREIGSLQGLLEANLTGRVVRFDYRALAVGIDLSDLGFQPDEEADGIFIQDAEDGEGRVDPVFIGGLP